MITLQVALKPQVPRQGFLHFWLPQVSVKGQSELTTHSGLQLGGAPRKPGTHEQTPCSLTLRQILFGPQGDGLQGSLFTGSRFYDGKNVLILISFDRSVISLPRTIEHCTNAFPDILAGQLHMGT